MGATASPRTIAEDLVERLHGPAERMSDHVPVGDEFEDLGLEIGEVCEVRCT
jgi:hypothetical protein